jgi:2,3-bisphosphoglycerate-dependent phosphoglycerate mutase
MSYLILVRHGKSEWNQLGLWTGHTEVELNEEGKAEARKAGEALRDIDVHSIHVSSMKRTQQTAEHIKEALGISHMPHTSHDDLKERHYGVFTGKNKWQVKEEIGEEAFQKIRRGWDVVIPEGESLKDVHARVSKYYDQHIKPELESGKNVLVVAHGNSLRALAKHVEELTDEEVVALEIGTGEVHVYHMGEGAKVAHKEIRSVNDQTGKV